MRLLIIEDETGITTPLKKALEKEGYAVDVANDGKTGFEMAVVNGYDCLILDLNLPEMDGITIARKLRKDGHTTPILMLTARSTLEEKWEGFESGTDDYLTKPFDYKELLFRISALIKRASMHKEEILECHNVSLNSKAKSVTVSGKQVELNNKEFGILEYLMRNSGTIVSAEDLLEHVWDDDVNVFTQTIRTNIKTLRKKVDPGKDLIKTRRGSGYIIE